MDPRLRRLVADQQMMRRLVSASPLIRMTFMGEPATRYRVTYLCGGIAREPETGRLKRYGRHIADIYLHSDYPRVLPEVVWRTPIFHPNFRVRSGGGTVCVPSWTPGQSLAGLVHHMGMMVQYQVCDLRYPLDPDAAMWAADHQHLLPVDKRPLVPEGFTTELTALGESPP